MTTCRSPRTPTYRLHKGSGQALVEIDGERIYLGVYGRPETEQAYHRIIAQWLANGRRLPQPAKDMTVVELIDQFWAFAVSYYRRPDGKPS